MEQWMDAMLSLQQTQAQAMFKVARAVAQMDTSKEILPFNQARQDFDRLQEKIGAVDALADAWRVGR